MSVTFQPEQCRLVLDGKHDESVGAGVPVGEQLRVFHREVKRGVRGLNSLGGRREIPARNQVEAAMALVRIHDSIIH